MKLKALSAAIALAAIGTGSAHAASFAAGNAIGFPSELVLAVTDSTVGSANFNNTYLLDLGYTYAALVNGTLKSHTWNFATDPNFLSHFQAGDTLTYNVVGAYAGDSTNLTNLDKSSVNFPFSDVAQWGLVTTAKNVSQLNTGYSNLANSAGLDTASGAANGWIGLVANQIPNGGATSAYIAGTSAGSWLVNNFSIGFSAPAATSLVTGTSNLYWLTNPTLGATGDAPHLLGQLNLSNSGTLTLSQSSASPVPVPAALWMVAPALLGVFRFVSGKNHVLA